jgi:hypothetical protein
MHYAVGLCSTCPPLAGPYPADAAAAPAAALADLRLAALAR